MHVSRAAALWRFLAIPAQDAGIVPVRPQLDAIDLALKAKIQDLKALVDSSHDHIVALETAMDGKAPVVHTHSIAQVANLQAALTSLQTRVTALEAKVP